MKTTNLIITQSNQPSNNDNRLVAFEQPYVPGAICRFCNNPAEPCITPPLCPSHLDVVMIIHHLQKTDQAVTLDNALAVLRRALANDGQWTLTEETLPPLLDDFLQKPGREDLS